MASKLQDLQQYFLDVRTEFKKVTWPSQREYVGGTIGVLVMVSIITTVLSVIDMGLAQVMQLIVPK